MLVQEHLQGYKLPQVWQDLVRREEVFELMKTTCNRPLKVVNKISREVCSRGKGWGYTHDHAWRTVVIGPLTWQPNNGSRTERVCRHSAGQVALHEE